MTERWDHVPLLALPWLWALFALGIGAAWLLRARSQARRIRNLEIAARALRERNFPPPHDESDDVFGRLVLAVHRLAGDLHQRIEVLERDRIERERIIAHMTDGVALIDGADRLLRANHSMAMLVGAPLPPAPGTPFHEFIRAPEIDAVISEARTTRTTVEAEVRLWSPRQRLVRATATPLGSGDRGQVLLVMHDLDEEERVTRMRQDFVANVSHELRTPLTSLRGYAETLLDGGLDDAANREVFVRVIRDQAVRLAALVDDLLSLADLERPGAELKIERFDLRGLARRQAAMLGQGAAQNGLELKVAGDEPLWVEADRARIEQVLANLIDNAIKYTERGRVVVSAGEGDGFWWCEVADTGHGIPAEDQPRIFERFYRVDKARSREKGGTGLGLSIVKHIVALHGGDISVHSRIGSGSTFRFEIPRSVHEGAAE